MTNQATDVKMILRDPERLAQVMENAAKSAEKIDSATQNAGRSAGKVIGPYTRLQKSVDTLAAGTAPGNSTSHNELLDMVYNARQAQDRVRKLESPRPGFIRSTLSRMSRVPMDLSSVASAGLSAVGAAGPEGKAIELLGNAAIEAVGKIKELADSAAASGRQMTELRVSTGATNGEAARLGGIGATSGDVTGVRNRALSDPYAYAQAQQAGVSFLPGPMGEATGGKDFLRLLEGIRRQSEAQQRISLRTLGLEGFAGLMKVSNQTFDQLKTDAKLTAQIMNDGFQNIGAEYNASSKRVETAKENLSATAGRPWMQDITNIQNSAADAGNGIAAWSNRNQGITKAITRFLEFAIIPQIGGIALASENYQKSKGSAAGTEKPEDKIAGATDRLSMAIARLSAGNVGHGEGFDNAIPGALKSGQYLAVAAAHGELAAMSMH